MGRGPQYIALLFSYKATVIGLLIMVLLMLSLGNAYAQVNIASVTPLDSNTYSVDSSNKRLVRKDTVSQTISTLNTNATVEADSAAPPAKKAPLHSARKAAYLSAVLPGLGQAYNKKYWKIPIVYAGFGGLAYALYYTTSNFNGYRAAYRLQVATVPNPNASFNGVADAATLKVYRDYFKKYVDISAIGIGVWYLINIIDATVDGHLSSWNMKDDLSVTWTPILLTNPNYSSAAAGLSLTLHF